MDHSQTMGAEFPDKIGFVNVLSTQQTVYLASHKQLGAVSCHWNTKQIGSQTMEN